MKFFVFAAILSMLVIQNINGQPIVKGPCKMSIMVACADGSTPTSGPPDANGCPTQKCPGTPVTPVTPIARCPYNMIYCPNGSLITGTNPTTGCPTYTCSGPVILPIATTEK